MIPQTATSQYHNLATGSTTTPCHFSFLANSVSEFESENASKGGLLERANKALTPFPSLNSRQIKRTILMLIFSMSVVALSGCGSAEGCSKTGGGGRSQSCSCKTGRYNCVIVNLALSFGLPAAFALRRRSILRSV